MDGQASTITPDPAASPAAPPIIELVEELPHGDESKDPHERSRILWVSSGDTIAKLRPATEADADAPRYTLGEGVQLCEAENIVRATRTGRLTVRNQRLSIESSLVIDGNVDFHVGNIHCPSEILIHGDVADQFKVHGGASIEVRGVIEAAEVVAAGDLHAKGGISGKDKSLCRAGGNIDARYIVHGNIEAVGNIVCRTITNSHVVSRGEVRVAGPIVGSHVSAGCSVECRSLGAEAGTKTVVEVGIDPELRKLAVEEIPLILAQQQKAQKIHESIAPFLKNQNHLTPPQNQWLSKALAAVEQLEANTSSKLSKLKELYEREQRNTSGWVEVHHGLFPGSVICFPGYTTSIDKPVTQLVRIVCRQIENETKVCLLYGNSGAPHPLPTRSCADETSARLRRLLHPPHN